ncbi:hypothetical protein [Mycolicibacterium confluentis]|uniref:Uncharacterized protein n=1 Tax=Mycolicibacterium confluentis TaxID=28047 RepID=A0A7I7Y1M3_9MYCO|nr:hypothetical protein [Mycolicibacterium confluentis]MCV7320430.1 hypothetical protein [Mycolicibacterium confluentis]ORV21850.1 hypothetical protein AWB99_05770 [Mycolicibacterium confluentis]BBZ35469.1 hypothetical protein MCNF_40740 [Mycolicibacterium confluentis]
MTARIVFGNLALVGLAIAGALSLFPLWRSRTLSPDAIKRRTYWSGTVIATVCMFLAAWPDWRVGLFVSTAVGLTLVVLAGRYTRHIKIRGRVYGMPGANVPDRPPSRAPED